MTDSKFKSNIMFIFNCNSVIDHIYYEACRDRRRVVVMIFLKKIRVLHFFLILTLFNAYYTNMAYKMVPSTHSMLYIYEYMHRKLVFLTCPSDLKKKDYSIIIFVT